MEHLSRTRILNLIKEAVKFSPQSLGSARPNTFAVIDSIADFNAPNFGYTALDLTTDAWTRKQSTVNNLDLEFPRVGVILYDGSIDYKSDNLDFQTISDQVRILFADKYIDQKGSNTAKDLRSKTQIIADTEKGILKIVEYLRAVAPFRVQVTSGVYVEDYFTKGLLDAAITAGKIISYQTHEEYRSLLKYYNDYTEFLRKNMNIRKSILEHKPTDHEIVGTWITLNLQSYACSDGNFDYFVDNSILNDNKTTYLGR